MAIQLNWVETSQPFKYTTHFLFYIPCPQKNLGKMIKYNTQYLYYRTLKLHTMQPFLCKRLALRFIAFQTIRIEAQASCFVEADLELLCVSYPSATDFSAIQFLLFSRSSSNSPRSFQRFRRTLVQNFNQIRQRVRNFPIDSDCKNHPLSAML